MALKKAEFSDNEIPIFEEALVYKRGEYWQMRMWLAKEHKYARFSLKTRNRSTAVDKAKLHYHELMAGQLQGKTYFSITTKMGVEMYLEHRKLDVDNGFIVRGRHTTIATHLKHWLNFIGKDVKLKELERTDCENYFAKRTKTKGKAELRISQTTVENEQSTVNAMIAWLHKKKETYIDGFDFKKLKAVDKGVEANRRNTFTDAEVAVWTAELARYIKEAERDLSEPNNYVKAVCGYYIGFSLITGLRRGEQLQLKWSDVEDMEHELARKNSYDLIKVTVRGETSKVRKTRKFVVKDSIYVKGLLELTRQRHKGGIKETELNRLVQNELMFSTNGKTAVHARELLLLVYRFAIGKGVEVKNPADSIARKAIATFKPRERNLNRHEIKTFFEALQHTATAPTLRLALKFMLLTGVRKGEFIGATWKEVDWGRASWTIPKVRMKADREHVVYL